jgi:hypothetical protein
MSLRGPEHVVPIALANSDDKIEKMDERRYKLLPANDIPASQIKPRTRCSSDP